MKVRLSAPVLLALLLLVAAGIGVVAVYQATPLAWTVDVGGPLSGPLLGSGFYADEVAAGEPLAQDRDRQHHRGNRVEG